MVRVLLRLFAAASSTMAWRSHGRTNAELVSKLAGSGIAGSPAVQTAMASVDRRDFVAPGTEGEAYLDMPQPIGHGECGGRAHAAGRNAQAEGRAAR